MNEQPIPNAENVPAAEPVPTPEPTPGAELQPTPGTPPADPAPGEPNPASVEEDPAKAVPESADAYSFEIDDFDGDAFKAENGQVLERFHKAGLTNEQASEVVQIWNEFQQANMEALQQEWGEQFNSNIGLAKNALEALGFDAKKLDSPTGALELAAAIGKHIQEDLPPSNTQQNGTESLQQLMMSEAYLNDKHPDHQRVYAQVQKAYEKQYL